MSNFWYNWATLNLNIWSHCQPYSDNFSPIDPRHQRDQIGQFLKVLVNKLYYKSSPNIWKSTPFKVKTLVAIVWAFGELLWKLGYFYSTIWPHCSSRTKELCAHQVQLLQRGQLVELATAQVADPVLLQVEDEQLGEAFERLVAHVHDAARVQVERRLRQQKSWCVLEGSSFVSRVFEAAYGFVKLT